MTRQINKVKLVQSVIRHFLHRIKRKGNIILRHMFIALNIKACFLFKQVRRESKDIVAPMFREFALLNEVLTKFKTQEKYMRRSHRRLESYRFTRHIRLVSLVVLLERLEAVLTKRQNLFLTEPIEKLSKKKEQRRKSLVDFIRHDWYEVLLFW
jgi:hypothetical protein